MCLLDRISGLNHSNRRHSYSLLALRLDTALRASTLLQLGDFLILHPLAYLFQGQIELNLHILVSKAADPQFVRSRVSLETIFKLVQVFELAA